MVGTLLGLVLAAVKTSLLGRWRGEEVEAGRVCHREGEEPGVSGPSCHQQYGSLGSRGRRAGISQKELPESLSTQGRASRRCRMRRPLQGPGGDDSLLRRALLTGVHSPGGQEARGMQRRVGVGGRAEGMRPKSEASRAALSPSELSARGRGRECLTAAAREQLRPWTSLGSSPACHPLALQTRPDARLL